MAGDPEPATSYRISMPSGETAAGLIDDRSAVRQGRMFWLSRNTLSGSQARLSATSRSYLASP